jgi:formylglycine-generating enzyme required for sulfatase activity
MRAWLAGIAIATAVAIAPAEAQPREPEMVTIPAGTFVMGTSYAEDKREHIYGKASDWSKPQHTVTVDAFLLAKTTVTRGEFAAFVKAKGDLPKADRSDRLLSPVFFGCQNYKYNDDGELEWGPDEARDWRHPGFDQTDADPVVCVNYDDTLAYIDWLNDVTGKNYRLPSEAEWEYAARGKANRDASHFWGDERTTACQYANVPDRSLAEALRLDPGTPDGFFQCTDGFAFTAPVASFRPNDFGLYDMLGNVEQLTADSWNEDYEKQTETKRPILARIYAQHSVRGGSWAIDARELRSGRRSAAMVGYRASTIGFRLASSL